MSVERRRNLVLIVAALALAAGGVGYAVFGERTAGDAAVTLSETPASTAPSDAPRAVSETAAPEPGTVAEASPAQSSAQPGPVQPGPVQPGPAESGPAETVVAAIDPAQAPSEPTAQLALPVEPAAPVAQAARAPLDAAFDLVRVEPTGDAVIAGQAPPGARVELLRNGMVHDIVVADATGAFAFVPPPLPPGTHEIALQVRDGDAAPRRSPQSVTVVVAERMDEAPVVALVAPDAPTRILSRPEPTPAAPESDVAAAASEPVADEAALVRDASGEPPEPAAEDGLQPTQVARADAAGPVGDRRGIRVAAVEAETGGGLFVSGAGEPNASVRLYLNETFVGRASADHAGLVSFAIRRGVRPGVYRVRLDEVDTRDGAVLSRAEVAFEMPEVLAATGEPAEPAAGQPQSPAETVAGVAPETLADTQTAAVAGDGAADADIAVAEAPEREATLTIPEIGTALVSRGDSLWRISRRIYGEGIRYTVIFDANQEQIRNPNLIYPGQIFVLPALERDEAADAAAQ